MNGNYLTRRPRYADIIRAQYPAAMQRYFRDLAYRQDQNALAQQAAQFDEMTELERQQMEFERQQMEDSRSQANTANLLAGAGLAKEAVPRLYRGGMDLYRYAMGSADEGEQAINDVFTPQYQSPDMQNLISEYPFSPGEGETAVPPGQQAIYDTYEPVYQTRGVDTLLQGDYAGTGESAIPLRQNPISQTYEPVYQTRAYTDLIQAAPEYIGAGEVALAPGYEAGAGAINSLFTPAYTSPAYDALVAEGASAAGGLGAGEAAVSSGAEGAAAAGGGLSWWGGPVIAAATFGQQAAARGSEPVEGVAPGDFFSVEDGNWKPRFAEPDKNYFSQRWGGGPTTGARFDARLQRGDIGGTARAFPGFAHGYAIPGLDVAGNVVGGYVSRQAGDTAGKAAQSLVDPVGTITSSLAEDKDVGDVAATILTGGLSHFCTAITKIIGMSNPQTAMMKVFRNWATENRKEQALHYFEYGGEVVNKIRESFKTSDEEKAFFEKLKQEMVYGTLHFMAFDRMKEAADHYWNKYLELTKEYAPEFYPGYAKAEMPGD